MVLPLVEGGVVLAELSHVGTGRVGRPGGCMAVLSF